MKRHILFAFVCSAFLFSACNESTADLLVELTYANGDAATSVETLLFTSEDDFASLNEDAATLVISDENGWSNFKELEPNTYWVWARANTRSAGGLIILSEGNNVLKLVLK